MGILNTILTVKRVQLASWFNYPLWQTNNVQGSIFLSALQKDFTKLFAPNTTALFGSLTGVDKWEGGVLAPNGKIYGIPANSTQVLEIDPINNTTAVFGSLTGTDKWRGGVLAPNGKIYGMPYNSTQVLEIDPINNTIALFGSLTGVDKWRGGVLAPNGKIYGIPLNSTQVLEIGTALTINNNAVLSRYLNKF